MWTSIKCRHIYHSWTCKQFLQTCERFRGCCLLGVRNSLKCWTTKMLQSYWNIDFMYTQLFYIFPLSKIWHQRSSVSSRPCEWLRNAGQRRRQMSVLFRFVFLPWALSTLLGFLNAGIQLAATSANSVNILASSTMQKRLFHNYCSI